MGSLGFDHSQFLPVVSFFSLKIKLTQNNISGNKEQTSRIESQEKVNRKKQENELGFSWFYFVLYFQN